jgi:hypothetical protein
MNNQKINLQIEDFRFVDPISNFDPLGKSGYNTLEIKNISTVEFALANEEMVLKW